ARCSATHNRSAFNGRPGAKPRWNHKDRFPIHRDPLQSVVRRPRTATTPRAYAPLIGTCHMCSSGSLPSEFLGEPDENSFGAPDVAEPIRVLVLDHFADELGAAFGEPGERIVDVLHGEHDAQVTQSVHRGAAV